jgi:NAD(P)-dependent dehydrogenase (short-subunit alcohol dehydrogenase family)
MSMKVDLAGRVVLITGAGRGIGQAMAPAFALNGAAVAVNEIDRTGEGTVEVIRRQGGKAKLYLADVTDLKAVENMVAAVESELGPIDILVNNAGINPTRRVVQEYPPEVWDRVLHVDLYGVFYCSRAVALGMIERQRGSIINITSVLGIIPIREHSGFAAAKAGVVHFTRSHALEVGKFGVRVNAIAPGSTATEGWKPFFYDPANKQKLDSLMSHIPLGKPAEVEDIANAALFLASDAPKCITGHVLVVDGGWTAGFAREWWVGGPGFFDPLAGC